MSKQKNFRFSNESGASAQSIIILVACFSVISLITGYFLAHSTGTISGTSDPIIEDIVRPSNVRLNIN